MGYTLGTGVTTALKNILCRHQPTRLSASRTARVIPVIPVRFDVYINLNPKPFALNSIDLQY